MFGKRIAAWFVGLSYGGMLFAAVVLLQWSAPIGWGLAAEEAGEAPTPQRAADLAPPVRITAGGKPIVVEGFAAPCVGDFDEDGKNDLLIGQKGLGRLRVFRNTGTNARPEFDGFEWFTAGGRIAGVTICCRTAFTPQLVDFDAERYSALSDEYRELREQPEGETRQQRIQRYRKMLRKWQQYEALRSAGSTSSGNRYELRAGVWFYERIATENR